MIGILNIIIAAGFLAILYGYIVSKQILSASSGNKKMREIEPVYEFPGIRGTHPENTHNSA